MGGVPPNRISIRPLECIQCSTQVMPPPLLTSSPCLRGGKPSRHGGRRLPVIQHFVSLQGRTVSAQAFWERGESLRRWRCTRPAGRKGPGLQG